MKMELPDCPPGAEGYQDSVIEVPKKPEDNSSCTKAEQEFQDHLNSLKIKIEDDSYRCMVERRGRDVSGKWIYLCYPCAAVCSGEAILQTHVSGKKHKAKLAMRTVWPLSIFTNHPYNQNENANKVAATAKVLKKMAEEVEIFNQNPSDMDHKYGKLRDVRSHIQDTLDEVVAPLIGVEYLVEHPPQEDHHEPSYTCTLCNKQGHPRTIVNHMTCFWHRHNYLLRHYPKAADLLKPFRQQMRFRDGVGFIMNRIAHRIVAKYGRMKPIVIDKEVYDKEKERLHQWIFKGPHFAETIDCTFEEVVDTDLINTINKTSTQKNALRDPSPPTVAAPRPHNANRGAAARRERLVSVESLSDLSDEFDAAARPSPKGDRYKSGVGGRAVQAQRPRYEPYPERGKYAAKNTAPAKTGDSTKTARQPNYSYKLQMAKERRLALEEAATKSIAYHEKNPEKHPLYPDEWKKFWNRRYKEIQAEGKDPSKHDFKPEWIVYWTGRMKELHKEELRSQVNEIYRRLCLTPPPAHAPPPDAPAARRRSPDRRDWNRSPESARRRSPPQFRASAGRHPQERRRSPAHFRRERRSPSGVHARAAPRRYSPTRPSMRLRSRSPVHKDSSPRTNYVLESRGSRSPLSRRETAHRNRSPGPRNRSPGPRNRSPALRNRSPTSRNRSPSSRNRSPTSRNRSPAPRAPSSSFGRSELKAHSSSRNRSAEPSGLQTVLISDDELKPDDGAASPWRSGGSLGSLPDALSPPRAAPPPDDVVATLRSLVALEDYLGSLGPRVVDLLAEAIRMEKERANSSEELLERESATVLIETAKEKLKGAAQAGLVASAAVAAVRAAVVRAAATLHEADKRARQKKAESNKRLLSSTPSSSAAALPVAGVGAVDRAQIAQQMAAALVAQGKTDVTEEELAQLVEAVVGMAEAKKREANEKKQAAVRPPAARTGSAAARSGTASALQLLQSAYDDKKGEREDAPDAMDGLSDSDLETLLKNFNELSAEEQHSLIAYLKKLEAREPQRVERLRQYVSAAAGHAPAPAAPSAPPAALADTAPVPIESDDDDYTVEEVFKSATEKVKEDQIRQEMEIVKKSLEESKASEPEVVTAASHASAEVDLAKNMSSAANLLALVQASLQSGNKPLLATPQVADVVSSNTQPRSFGDLPESSTIRSHNAPQPAPNAAPSQNQQPFEREGLIRVAQNLTHIASAPNPHVEPRFGGNNSDMQNAPQGVGNEVLNTDRSFGGNNSNMQNEPRFPGNSNMHTDHSFAGNDRGMQNEPRFGGNSKMHADQPFGRNIPNIQNEPRFAANPRMNMDQFGGNNSNIQMESRYDGNSNMHTDQSFGGNIPSEHNDSRFGNMHNEQGMGGNAPSTNIPGMRQEQPYGGSNAYSDQSSYKAPTWEPRQDMQRDYNNYPQDGGTYNQGNQDMYNNQASYTGNYNNMNSGMQENYDGRPQNPKQQFGKFDQSKKRGRGGGRPFGGRGRGRGRGSW